MTIYLSLSLFCDLKDVPEQVEETLKYILRNQDYEFNNPPVHPFFRESSIPECSWRNIFQNHEWGSDLTTFMGTNIRVFSSGFFGKSLSLRCEIEADHDFIHSHFLFLQWLAPYVYVEEKGELVGFIERYNARSNDPILVYFIDGKIFFKKVVEPLKLVEMNAESIESFFCD